MNKNCKSLVLLAVLIVGAFFVSPVMARRYDVTLYGYDRWVPQDYRYESRSIPETVAPEVAATTRTEYIAEAGRTVDISQKGNFDPVGNVLGVFVWIADSVGSVLGR